MPHQIYLTDEEFDKLNMYEQIHYRWCEKCERFWDTRLVNKCYHKEG